MENLLQRFSNSNLKQSELEEEEVELNLGLSLGGKFGVDRTSNKLIRSSSIAGPFPLRDVNETVVPPAVTVAVAVAVPYPSLARTCSLPVETEEEWRKRKEIQSLRRMAAKRRRSEKQRAVKGEMEVNVNVNVNIKEQGGRDHYIAAMTKVRSSATPQFGLPSWAAAAKQSIRGVGIEALIGRGKINDSFAHAASPGSNKASTDSESEKKTQTPQGTSDCGDMSQVSIQPVLEPNNQITVGTAGTQSGGAASIPSGPETENPTKGLDAAAAAANRRKTELNSLEDMPSVFTEGEGPNGRRIEGILYKYGKGEDVMIMCVCHGDFHSPAGFVKHAGGTDTNRPLKHIVINSNSLLA